VSAPTTRPPEQSATAPNGGHAAPGAAKPAPTAGPAQPKRIAPHQLTGAQAVIRALEELDVDTIFGIPGGAVLPVYDPLFDSQKLRHVLRRHSHPHLQQARRPISKPHGASYWPSGNPYLRVETTLDSCADAISTRRSFHDCGIHEGL